MSGRQGFFRWATRVGGGLAGLLLLVYLFRWPLLGGIARAEVAKAVAQELQGELRQASLSGSLLFGAEAKDVVVAGAGDVPYRELHAARIVARYGFLGLGRLRLDFEGVRVAFVDPHPERPPDRPKIVRDAEEIVRKLKVDGRLRLRDGELTLPDGLRITIEEAEIDGETLRGRARIPGFGLVEASRVDGVVEATASEGPIRYARLTREGQAFRFAATIEGRAVQGEGTAAYGADDTLLRAEATARADLGEAKIRADFHSGRVDGEGTVAIDVEDPVRARVEIRGRIAGPLMGPLKGWTLTEAVARSPRLAWRDLAFEEVLVEIPDATLDAVTWKGSARRGPDSIEGEGRFLGGRVEGDVRARIASTKPYFPDVEAEELVVQGRFHSAGGVHFSGRVEAGAGTAGGIGWSSLDGDVTLSPQAVESAALRVRGLPGAPELLVSGSVDRHPASLRIRADARAGEDVARVEGVLEGERFEGRVAGSFAGARGAARIVRDAQGIRASFEPGAIRGFTHGDLEVQLSDGRALLKEADVAWGRIKGRLSAELRWTKDVVSGDLRARALEMGGASFGSASLRFKRGTSIELDGVWTGEDGASAELKGTWGQPSDLRAALRVPDLSRPWPRSLIAGAPKLRGSLDVDARLRGEALEGRLLLRDAAVEGGPAFTLEIPFRGHDNDVHLSLPETSTPFGRLALDARLPLPGSPRPAEGRARFRTRDLTVFRPFVPEEVRDYVPGGTLELEASLSGPEWLATASLVAPLLRLPEPLSPVKDLQLKASIGNDGLRVDKIWGRMGGGTFEASLRRETAGPYRGTLKGDELLAVTTGLSHIRVSADVGFLWEEGRPARLTGKLDVPLALVHEEPGSSGGGGGGALAVGGLRLRPAPGGGVLVPGIPGLEKVALDLEVATTGETRVENSVVGALLRANGRLRGTLAAPAASGVVEARSGEVKLPAAIFVRVEEARVSVPSEPGIDPYVHFVGRVGRGDGSIEVRVDGPLARPELRLASDPPAPQEELLARLAFGHPPGQVQGAALGVFALRLFEQYTAGWPRAEPSDSLLSRLKPTIFSEEAEIEERRRPWELPSGRSPRGMTVRTEYLWSPYFSIVGEADRESNVGGDIKLRLRFK